MGELELEENQSFEMLQRRRMARLNELLDKIGLGGPENFGLNRQTLYVIGRLLMRHLQEDLSKQK